MVVITNEYSACIGILLRMQRMGTIRSKKSRLPMDVNGREGEGVNGVDIMECSQAYCQREYALKREPCSLMGPKIGQDNFTIYNAKSNTEIISF